MSPQRLRVLMIAFFVAAAVLSGIAGDDRGPALVAAAVCFSAGLVLFFRWRRALRATVVEGANATEGRPR